jgi:flagellar M-ring protein FliF
MDLSISNLFQSIKGFLAKLSRGKKIGLAALLVSVLVGAIILVNVLDSAGYTVLYRGLSASESVDIVNMLDSMGTVYKLQTDGTIMVPKASEAMLKMQLAAEGFPKSTMGYDIFTSQSALMTTDYEKRQYLIFQLQDRLQESLKTLEGVKNAIVTLNVPEENSFVLKADKPQATASVVLDLYSYTSLNDKQIRGIEALVSRSVPGLQSENVAIVDSTGVVLNEETEELSGQALSQIDAISKINEYYKKKITSFLEPVFGADGMSVAVNVQVDFQQRTSEKTTYAPVVGETGILSKEEYDRQSLNGGTVQGVAAGTDANTGTPTYTNQTNGAADQSASDSGSNEYLVNQLIEGIEDNGGRITDMTVAVIVNSSLTDEQVTKYKEMVAFGAGISVDKVVITQAEFTPKEPPALPQEQASGMNGLLLAIAGGFALLLALAAFFTLRAGRKKKKNRQHVPLAKGQQGQRQQPGKRTGQEAAQQDEKQEVPGEIVLTETREQGIKRQVKEFASANPEIVAQLLRTWMKEDEAK